MTTARSATANLIEAATTPRARRRRSEARAKTATTAVAYLRVSTEEQAVSGLGLEAQREAVSAYAALHGLTIVEWFSDEGISGATLGKRPAMLEALRAMDAGRAGVLLAKDATRLSRTLADLAAMLDAANADGWCVQTADGLVDTCDPNGALLPKFLGIVGELERLFTSQRTKAALQAAKARGVKLGHASALPAAVQHRIVMERKAGRTFQAICDGLTADGVPTANGGQWWPRTVRAVCVAAA